VRPNADLPVTGAGAQQSQEGTRIVFHVSQP
jgi:hypothetical protein